MKKKWSATADPLMSAALVFILLVIWQLVSPLIPTYILPSPLAILRSLVAQFSLIMGHAALTAAAALGGIAIAVVLAVGAAVFMDALPFAYRMLYPLAVVSQTIPLIAVAPLFVLWFGFGFLPKILAVVLVCFFPILVNVLQSFRSLEGRYIGLMKSMGAKSGHIYRYVKIPGSMPEFFAGLRIAATYSVMGAVIGEWLGGSAGLGVYLIRSQKSFASSQVFAAILVISLMSGLFFLLVRGIEELVRPRPARSSINT